jgi:hypothetical protein
MVAGADRQVQKVIPDCLWKSRLQEREGPLPGGQLRRTFCQLNQRFRVQLCGGSKGHR